MNSSPHALTLNARTLRLGGPLGWVDVSYAEYSLLRAFAQGENQRVETSRMLEHIGKAADDTTKRALEVQLVRLRKKLAQVGATAPTIKAIRGFGYQLCIPLAVPPAPTFAQTECAPQFPS